MATHGCEACGDSVELLLLICPCVMMVIATPIFLYIMIVGLPTILIWCYCLIPYHLICLYFVLSVLKREFKYHLRKFTVGLTAEEIEIEDDLQMRKDEIPCC
jgi:hypothetical protein